MTKWLTIIIVVLAVVGGGVFLIGMMLPQSHVASRTAHLTQPPEKVWATITDVNAFPSWRTDVASVEKLASANDKLTWRESSTNRNKLTFEAEVFEAPSHLVTRITDKGLPFGGKWDYAISPENGGSSITITEYGEVYNPVFRVVSKFMSKTATIDSYLEALAARLGDSYTPAA